MPLFLLKAVGWITGTKTGQFVALGAALLVALAIYTAWQRSDAADDALSKIREVNNELSNQAIDAREGARRCRDAGGVWKFDTGKCARPE